ncbi:MAG: hypothetical protein NXI14_11715 [bacterium]|nr:hypothetical protein [bacterium]
MSMQQPVKFTYVPDVFRPNDCRVLQGDPSVPLAAGVWECHRIDDMNQARIHCLDSALHSLRPSLEADWDAWLIASVRAVDTDREFIRRRIGGLWKSLARGDIAFEYAAPIEVEHPQADGTRYVGATRWTCDESHAVNAAMRRDYAIPLLMHREAPTTQIIEGIINVNWDATSRVVPTHILVVLENEHSALIDIWSEFDDREIVVSVVGRPEVLAGLGIHPQSESPR